MKLADKFQEKVKAEVDKFDDMSLGQIKLSLVYGTGKLAEFLLGGDEETFQVAVTTILRGLNLLEKRLNFVAVDLESPPDVYDSEQVVYLLAKAVSRIVEGDFYSGSARAKYWLTYYLTNFAKESGNALQSGD